MPSCNCIKWCGTNGEYIVPPVPYKSPGENVTKVKKPHPITRPPSVTQPPTITQPPTSTETQPPTSTDMPVIQTDGGATTAISKRLTIIEQRIQELIDNGNATDNNGEINERFEGSIMARRSGIRLETTDLEKELVTIDKTPEQNALLHDALRQNEFLKNILTDTTRQLIIDVLVPEDLTAEAVIIKQGQTGDYMYISESGQYEVYKDNELVKTFDVPTVFGEVAIIYDHKRQATVKALTDGKLWKISRGDYSRVMVKSAKENDYEIVNFLKTVPKIQDAPESRLKEAGGLFKLTTFVSGTNIVQQGEDGNEFFIIRAGSVKVTKDSEELASLNRGKWFGEQALLANDKKRQATVCADSPIVECLVLSSEDFLNLFGDLEGFMSEPKNKSSTISVAAKPQNIYSDVKVTDLKLVATLGVGGFGRVELAHLIKDNKVTFALKYLKRKHIVENNQIRHVLNEKIIQYRCNSEFIVQLYNTYNDEKYLYLLLEPCLGGDVLSLLQRLKFHCCKEEDAKFLAACVLEALSFLHDRKIVFRDLKPENMMLDKRGYVKLTDFGFAKKLEHGVKTYTFAGTPEYVSPEIIYQRGHDRAVDCWAFGIFIFELLVGRTPFKTSDPSYMQTYNLIVRGIHNVVFPTKIKAIATVLIRKLCVGAPTQRLGYKKNGWQEIREHKWYQGFNWDKLQSRGMTSPFARQLTNHLDTRYFDKQPRDTQIPEKDFTEELNNF